MWVSTEEETNHTDPGYNKFLLITTCNQNETTRKRKYRSTDNTNGIKRGKWRDLQMKGINKLKQLSYLSFCMHITCHIWVVECISVVACISVVISELLQTYQWSYLSCWMHISCISSYLSNWMHISCHIWVIECISVVISE